jgi:pentatricopeptide repeat protein
MEYFFAMAGLYRLTLPNLNRLISLQGRSTVWRKLSTSRSLRIPLRLEKATELAPSKDVNKYNALMIRYKLEWKKALKLYTEMKQKGVQANQSTYIALFSALAQGKQAVEASVILIEMKKGVTPNVTAYNSAIHVYVRSENLTEAEKLFREMEDQGVKPNVVTYNTLMKGYKHQWKKALELYEDMKKQQVQANGYTYSALFSALAQGKQREKAFVIFQDIKKEGITPDVNVYNSMIDLCVRSENLTEAEKLFREMEDQGVKPDVVTYTTLMKGYKHNWEKALKLYEDMKKQGVQANGYTYNTLVPALIQGNQREKASLIRREMKKKGML